ncbi:hypothetical protein T440DRAFT_482534 [Plenodomus tracheiphilus IPT5]|uniref:Uncharacterized protein n=1 Tax=Plenodomus tracheiphilus IPT5 TaxID=1408161 RepID=A0A6A7ATA8_9PLEO|nr:hypothetical protein T440DRAFT_482534 [Plenodomus tracheiphilus IPT5]
MAVLSLPPTALHDAADHTLTFRIAECCHRRDPQSWVASKWRESASQSRAAGPDDVLVGDGAPVAERRDGDTAHNGDVCCRRAAVVPLESASLCNAYLVMLLQPFAGAPISGAEDCRTHVTAFTGLLGSSTCIDTVEAWVCSLEFGSMEPAETPPD